MGHVFLGVTRAGAASERPYGEKTQGYTGREMNPRPYARIVRLRRVVISSMAAMQANGTAMP